MLLVGCIFVWLLTVHPAGLTPDTQPLSAPLMCPLDQSPETHDGLNTRTCTIKGIKTSLR